MVNTPNTIDTDYSNLNKSLQTRRKIDNIKTDVGEAIWKVFLQTNKFNERKRASTRNNRLNQFSRSIEWASEWMKTNFVLTVDYLSENSLMTTNKIKSLNLRALNDETKTPDEKLQAVLNDLTQWLKEPDRLKLDQYVSKRLLNLSKEADSVDKLWEKITDLEQQNSDLKNELDALDAVSEVSERAVLTKRSKYKMIRIWNSIKNISDTSLDPETKARKILRQANSFAIFGSWKRFDWIVNKFPKKFDVNEEYKKSVDKLKKKMNESTDDGEKVAIRYIMKQVNKAYKDYIDATNISEDIRRKNMRDINTAMAA